MKTKYIDLIEQTFDFPQEEFDINKNGTLNFHGVNTMELIEKYGTPLKIFYLPKISKNIQKAKGWFKDAIAKINYSGSYNYCYCTKSAHFSFILNEALKNNIHIETSSAFDINIIEKLLEEKKITKDTYILCNGFKRDQYVQNIARLINGGFANCIPIIDNSKEIDYLTDATDKPFSIGIRIASEEEPKFEFYTSRLGIRYKDIVPYYLQHLKQYPNVKVKMLHFFINTGITDTSYYWNELTKCLRVYAELKKVCPELEALNIGGGFPIKKSLGFEFDYAYMVEEILLQIQAVCKEHNIPEPNIFTEFGSFTVGESGANLYKILDQKQQNDREKWNMINSSFMTTLPDSWAINQRFVFLPCNAWNDNYERVLLGGLTCDSDDYYNSEQHSNAIYLPKYSEKRDLYIGFFNTGAYQDTVGGFGGIQHCLIPKPKYIVIDKDETGNLNDYVFKEQQTAEEMLDILGY